MKITTFTQYFVVAALLVTAGAATLVYLALAEDSPPPRWYVPAQVSAGAAVFEKNCISCHGERGRGAANWRQRNPDGTFPPPPLNGTAHTWHHPLAALKYTIRNGGVQFGGNMPAFQGTLSEEEIDSVIAYFQSQWNDEVYQIWAQKINRRK